MIESLQGLLASYTFLGVLVIVALAIAFYLSVRRKILFEAWVDMRDNEESDLGRSVASLLLFKVRSIKQAHERSATKMDLWNPSEDVPAFRQGLDEDIELLGSVELGKYGSFISGLVMLVLRILPLILQPDKLRGSIHRYGDRLSLLASLDHFKLKRGGTRRTRLWEITTDNAALEKIPECVEELAYRIYLDLTGEELFKSWRGFRAYTQGLSHYLAYIDLRRDDDLRRAESLYEESLALEENNPVVLYNLGVLEYYLFREESNRKAIASFQGALSSQSWRLRARAHSGLANALTQDFHRFGGSSDTLLEAIEHGREAVLIDDKLDSAHKALAFASHQWAEAEEKRLRRALERGGLDPKQRLARERDIKQSRQLAIRHYERASNLNENHYIAYNNLGNLYLEWAVGQPPDSPHRRRLLRLARRKCEASLRVKPSYHHAHNNLGHVQWRLGEVELARRNFLSALRFAADYPEGTNDLGLLSLDPALGEETPAKGLDYHRRALELAGRGGGQKEKLCRLFQERLVPWREQISPDEMRELEAVGCQCFGD